MERPMKTWQLEKTGREHLQLIDQPKPEPGPEQILVRTQAVSLNYRDNAIVEGTYPLPVIFPLVPGSDLAGEGVAIGSNVTRFKPGDKIVSLYKQKWLNGVPTPGANGATLGSTPPGELSAYVRLPE